MVFLTVAVRMTLRIFAFNFVSHHKKRTNQHFLEKLIKSKAESKISVVKNSCLVVFFFKMLLLKALPISYENICDGSYF